MSRKLLLAIVVAIALVHSICGALAFAQSDPVVPIPDGIGSAVRGNINTRIQGNSPILVKTPSTPFASLGAEVDRQFQYCPDCQATVPCTGSGSGAYVLGYQGQWSCFQIGNAFNAANPGSGNDNAGGVNGFRTNEKNILDFGAIASNARLSCSTNASNAATCAGASTSDFAGSASGGLANSNEYGVLYGAGAAAAVSQPTGLVGQPVTRTATINTADYYSRLAQGCTVQNALAWCTAGSAICQVTNSDLYEKGNSVTIPGAGVSGANLSTTVAATNDYTNQITLAAAASTTVKGASMTGANCTTTRRYQAYPIDALSGWGTPTNVLTVSNTASALNWGDWVDVQLNVPQPTMQGSVPSWAVANAELPAFSTASIPWWPLPLNIPIAWVFYCGEGSSGALTMCGVEVPNESYRWSDQWTGVSTSRSGTTVTATAASGATLGDFLASAPINVLGSSQSAHNGTGLTVLAVGPCSGTCADSGATLNANQLRYTAGSSGTDSGTGATIAIPAPWNDELLGGNSKGWPTIITFRDVDRWYGTDTIEGISEPSSPPDENVYFQFSSISSNTVTITPKFGSSVAQTGSFEMGHDSGPNVNAAIAAATDTTHRSGTVYVPKTADLFPLASPIYVRDTIGLHLLGGGGPSFAEQPASSSGFLYVGPPGGTALTINGATAPLVEGLGIHSYDAAASLSGTTMGVVLDIDGYDDGDGLGFVNVTRPYVQDVYLGTANTGYRLANINGTNGDFGKFKDSTIWSYGVTPSAGGATYVTGNFMGMRINSGNALAGRIEGSDITGMIGVWSDTAGFYAQQTPFGNVSGIGILMGGNYTRPITWETSQNESLVRAVDAWGMGSNQNGSPIAIRGCDFSFMKALADDQFIVPTGPTQLTLEGNQFDPSDGEGPWQDYATLEFPNGFISYGGNTSGYGNIYSEGNAFFNICNPFGLLASVTQIHLKTDADLCNGSSGNAQPVDWPNNLCTSWQYTTSGGSVCLAKTNNGNDVQIGYGGTSRTVLGASGSLYVNSGLFDTPPITNSALGSCSSLATVRTTWVDDNDSACSTGGSPSHTSCTVGSSCHTCQVACAEGGSTWAWKETGAGN